MNTQQKLNAVIKVKGVETTPDKYLYFKSELRRICTLCFSDSTYIYKNIEKQLFESMSTQDKGLVDYEILQREEEFKLRAQSAIRSKKFK